MKPCAFFILLLGSALAGASPPSGKPLRLCAEDEWPPFSFNKAGNAMGANVDLVRQAFELQGYNVTFTPRSYSACLKLTQRGHFDAMLDVARNKERQGQFVWPKIPILVIPLHLIGNRSVAPATLDYSALRGQRVGITRGYEYPDKLLAQPGLIQVVSGSELGNFRQLITGNIDYMLLSPGTLSSLSQQLNQPEHPGVQDFGRVDSLDLFVAISHKYPEAKQLADDLDLGLKTLGRRSIPQQILRQWQAEP